MKRIRIEIINQFGSQRKFAKAIELHETTVSNILSGAMEATEDYQQKFVKALGFKWSELNKEI
jgi:plasmid maintenance system antidote protein VapI